MHCIKICSDDGYKTAAGFSLKNVYFQIFFYFEKPKIAGSH